VKKKIKMKSYREAEGKKKNGVWGKHGTKQKEH